MLKRGTKNMSSRRLRLETRSTNCSRCNGVRMSIAGRSILLTEYPGLVPFWTKRNPDYGSKMKTINCRDDSLIEDRGMWTTMKKKKRCIIVAQGFYEWLKKNNGKEKIPHFTKRKDGQLMCFAGLWDCVQFEGKRPLRTQSTEDSVFGISLQAAVENGILSRCIVAPRRFTATYACRRARKSRF